MAALVYRFRKNAMPKNFESGSFDPAVDRDFPPAIATIPATAQQHRAAVSVVIALVMITALVAPFANTQLGRVDTFVPVLQTVLATADVITAVLLRAQYVILPQRALLAVAAAYLCSAAFAFLAAMRRQASSVTEPTLLPGSSFSGT